MLDVQRRTADNVISMTMAPLLVLKKKRKKKPTSYIATQARRARAQRVIFPRVKLDGLARSCSCRVGTSSKQRQRAAFCDSTSHFKDLFIARRNILYVHCPYMGAARRSIENGPRNAFISYPTLPYPTLPVLVQACISSSPHFVQLPRVHTFHLKD